MKRNINSYLRRASSVDTPPTMENISPPILEKENYNILLLGMLGVGKSGKVIWYKK